MKEAEEAPKGARRGRKPQKVVEVPNLARKLKTVVRHTLPDLWRWFEDVPDPRDTTRTHYGMKKVLWTTLLLFLTLARSRRHFRTASDSPCFLANLNSLAEEKSDSVPHPDTVLLTLGRIDPATLASLPSQVVHTLLRKRILDSSRLEGRYLVAIDGTTVLSSKGRHCPHCLVQHHAGGGETYQHKVLEAKLVTPGGLALSVGTEFVENPSEDVPVQDCELKAFYRLAQRLKDDLPRTEICLLLDGLYANEEVLRLCRQNHWSYIITFKEGSAPRLAEDFETLRRLQPGNTLTVSENGETQRLSWVTGLAWGDQRLNVLECLLLHDSGQSEKRFVWITDIALTPRNVTTVANQGGRCRWIIENQGFNVQKNGEFHLEHPFSRQEWAWKNLYLLLQIVHVLLQLMYWWRELRPVREYLVSVYGFLRRFLEHMRTLDPPEEEPPEPAFQLRLDTS